VRPSTISKAAATVLVEGLVHVQFGASQVRCACDRDGRQPFPEIVRFYALRLADSDADQFAIGRDRARALPDLWPLASSADRPLERQILLRCRRGLPRPDFHRGSSCCGIAWQAARLPAGYRLFRSGSARRSHQSACAYRNSDHDGQRRHRRAAFGLECRMAARGVMP